ncbi:cell division protein FtsQ/DivIB [Carnobacterium divergens]|uniref:Cell division protein DivIB n=1 Tax=Carnobacterium divergens TaxID=2748 RepID=A0A7Z8CY94_CARDV|nr:cell division protein FtsQ/DivIB [Carnobacterium divergens]TFI70166.1 cell division protein FtsQ [Carnobacterium divergens]TFI75160.1 cell division protein FtsQ [Carnobacterium divergens]TFI80984.1 cell division protein FtsQ [Carnobacterium divergens]TFI93391.1 cell division protein FtsQ [Carnobacterium divergens]TFJ09423.1 cell division protein FtsQ [Carnobacterium divergens]
MANWNKRSSYKKKTAQEPASSLTPWEQEQQKRAAEQTSEKPVINKEKKKTKAEKKVVSMEHKLPRLKEQRRKKMLRRLIPMVFLFSFTILVILYFISPLSRISKVTVSGTNEVFDQSVIDTSQLKKGDSLWEAYFNRDKMEQEIKTELNQVKSVHLKFDGVNSYVLAIDEYKTVAYLAKDDQYYNILENGKIVKESRKVSIGNPPIFKNFKEGPALDEMILQYSQLSSDIKNSISDIEHQSSKTDDYLIKINMNDGNLVQASIPSFAEKMAYYPSFVKSLGEQKGIINMEVGVYFEAF